MRVLPQQVRRGCAFDPLPGHHQLQVASRRRHHRLCDRHLLLGAQGRDLRVLPGSGNHAADDLHAGRDPRYHRTDGRAEREDRDPFLVQRGGRLLQPARAGRRHQEGAAGIRDRLQAGQPPADRRFLAEELGRQPRQQRLGLEGTHRRGRDGSQHAEEHRRGRGRLSRSNQHNNKKLKSRDNDGHECF
ncbi:hypothetical protein MASSI9I_50114 [Massilia sp. 9I]|nr:hypothetical protein MASSI9I_50114 [Massilia sp. 9I]